MYQTEQDQHKTTAKQPTTNATTAVPPQQQQQKATVEQMGKAASTPTHQKPPKSPDREPKGNDRQARAHLCLKLEVPEEEVGHLLVVARPADEKQRQLRQPAAAAAAPALAPLCLAGGSRLVFWFEQRNLTKKNARIEDRSEETDGKKRCSQFCSRSFYRPLNRASRKEHSSGCPLRQCHHWPRMGILTILRYVHGTDHCCFNKQFQGKYKTPAMQVARRSLPRLVALKKRSERHGQTSVLHLAVRIKRHRIAQSNPIQSNPPVDTKAFLPATTLGVNLPNQRTHRSRRRTELNSKYNARRKKAFYLSLTGGVGLNNTRARVDGFSMGPPEGAPPDAHNIKRT